MNGKRRGFILGLLAGWAAVPSTWAADAKLHYSRDIKPILSNNCFACHGPDEGNRKAKLRLDVREAAVAERRGGRHAVMPGDAGKSALIERINTTDELDIMPPVKTGKKLTAEQKELLKRWIEQGAEYDQHWAYIKPARPAVPQVKDAAYPKNPVDNFIEARLDSEGVAHSPEADRRTLLRRLSFDLNGLPPTPEQVKAFAEDKSADAYEKQVERLLAAPQFGERMAAYWLDVVRFADTTGIHGDNDQVVWPYRDYVINAFNDNKPYDVFVQEQLAGDLLPNTGPEQRIASGYNRLNMTTREGGAQPKEYTAKYFADRVRNTSVTFFAGTMGCCECHNHKFDPYLTKDFYSFGAFFADLQEIAVGEQPPGIRLPTGSQTAELQRLDRRIAPFEQKFNADTPELTAALAEWEKQATSKKNINWTVLDPLIYTSQGGATLIRHPSVSIISVGTRPDRDTYAVTVRTELTGITGIRLEALTDATLPKNGPGRFDNGNFVLNEFRCTATPAGDPAQVVRVPLVNASADFSQNDYPVAGAIDGKPETGWAILPQAGQPHNAIFETKEPLGFAGGTLLTFELEHDYGTGHLLGMFRISVTTDPKPSVSNGPADIPQNIREILAVESAKRTPAQKKVLTDHFHNITPLLKDVRDRLTELRTQRGGVESGVATMLVSMVTEPRPIHILPRGNWMDDSGPIVQPAVPEFLPAINVKDRRLNRLDLANWMISPENPLVARVFVNRLWYLFFGQGIVKSLDDFGAQGAWPTHPELLDWLATEFRESGWDVRRMIRLMVTSRTYRQTSKGSHEVNQRDPQNQLLARQGRYRIDAEMVRDNALFISGLLSPKMFGPSVRPYQPAGYYQYLNFPLRDYTADKGENQYRRGLYTWWQRMFLHPSLKAFDAPSREECTVDRPRSNTPLQALVLLNDPTYVEAARVFAARVIRSGGSVFADRLRFAFQQALNRDPTPAEAKLLAELFEKHLKEYAADRAAAEALLKVGDSPAPPGIDTAELAAYTSVCRTILNLHELVTRD